MRTPFYKHTTVAKGRGNTKHLGGNQPADCKNGPLLIVSSFGSCGFLPQWQHPSLVIITVQNISRMACYINPSSSSSSTSSESTLPFSLPRPSSIVHGNDQHTMSLVSSPRHLHQPAIPNMGIVLHRPRASTTVSLRSPSSTARLTPADPVLGVSLVSGCAATFPSLELVRCRRPGGGHYAESAFAPPPPNYRPFWLFQANQWSLQGYQRFSTVA